jgi:beta-mannosidase
MLARSVYLSFGEADVKFSDNYVNLLPNEPLTIHISGNATLDELKSELKVISLIDAFSPSASNN